MPVELQYPLERIPESRFREIDRIVTGHAFEVQNQYGSLLPEPAYQQKLHQLLEDNGIQATREFTCDLRYGTYLHRFRIDLLVDRSVVYELKSVRELMTQHLDQLMNYLFLTNLPKGKLLNFQSPRVTYRYVNTSLTDSDRRIVKPVSRNWGDPDPDGFPLQEALLEILEDWGWGLSHQLYAEALSSVYPDKCRLEALELRDNQARLFSVQEQWVIPERGILKITTIREPTRHFISSLQKYLACSLYRNLHWINMYQSHIQFRVLHTSP